VIPTRPDLTRDMPDDPRGRHPSAFVAAVLSSLFPGLGQAYAGAPARALAIAVAPLLLVVLLAGLVLRVNHLELLGYLLDPTVLGVVLVLDLLLLGYRLVAMVDAWWVATRRGGRSAGDRWRPLSMVGLLAALVVAVGPHAALAFYDTQAQQLACIFDAVQNSCGAPTSSTEPAASGSSMGGPGASLPTSTGGPAAAGGRAALPTGTAVPVAPYTGGRLNVLLIGADQRPPDPTFNSDTMIVVSVDPATRQVAMFSLPRDTVNVPVPPGFAHGAYGSSFPGKINSLWTAAYGRRDLFPGTDLQRGFNALKAAIGYLYGIPISYYVEVNFTGFERLIDAMGGVTINVQMPVVDDNFPGDNPGDAGVPERIYIPAGLQHMTGAQALTYARSRHGSNDFDRAARQQRVLFSLKNQTDVGSLLPKVPALIASLRDAIHTDLPIGSLPRLLELAGSVDTSAIRSYVFAPPTYETQYMSDPFGLGRGYITVPNVAKIRAAVAGAMRASTPDAVRQQIAQEQPRVWVLDTNGDQAKASDLAAALSYDGMMASAPLDQAPAHTSTALIQVSNGARQRLPGTIAYLQELLGVQATDASNSQAHVDIVVTITDSTPDMTPPPAP
jgi:LCP family protein required for cell wall assembly